GLVWRLDSGFDRRCPKITGRTPSKRRPILLLREFERVFRRIAKTPDEREQQKETPDNGPYLDFLLSDRARRVFVAVLLQHDGSRRSGNRRILVGHWRLSQKVALDVNLRAD